MKSFLFLLLLFGCLTNLQATDPISKKTFYIQADLGFSFFHYYQQALFKKQSLSYHGALSVGHRSIPVYLEYVYPSSMRFDYRNNSIVDRYQEIGLRYNLNHLTYLIPLGLDPYVGVGLMWRKNEFTQFELQESTTPQILSQHQSSSTTYKLSAGIRAGRRNLILGLHYDYLPGGFQIPNPEGHTLQIFNNLHLFSVRVGIRLYQRPNHKIRCPRFKSKHKRSLSF
ncbi:hypothetical protein [Portibacter marinus]|uniref:hypothetical protein n=1 Tax=Portibacter marinus TaxID=2898660 RepID=UPI001F317A28|nr:hypothetical protein [Portibacter marinus]